MSYTVYGRVKYVDENNQCQGYVTGGWVRPYFKKVDSGSDESKWATNPYELDPINEGYFSFDVEDFDLLGPDGTYKKGKDKLYISFYWNKNNNNDNNKDSQNLTHAGFITHDIQVGDDFELNIIIKEIKKPLIVSSTLPNDIVTTKSILVMSENSQSDETWFVPTECEPIWYQQSISQKSIYDLVEIYANYKLSHVEYNWGIGSPQIINKPSNGSSSSNYNYNDAGIYNISINVENKLGKISTVSKQITVKYNKPNVNFSWNPTQTNDGKLKGQEPITFSNSTTDIDNRSDLYTYEWIIEDKFLDGSNNTIIYSDKNKSFSLIYSFTSPGLKTIKLRCYWNDGFNNLIEESIKTVTIHEFQITPNFIWNKIAQHRNDSITFSSTSIGDINKITSFNWIIPDNYPAPSSDFYVFSNIETSKFGEGSPNNLIRVDNTYNLSIESPIVKFHSNETRTIRMTLNYNNGWEEKSIFIEKSYQPNTYNLVPNISTSTVSPLGRNTSVSISNGTNDSNNLQYKCDLIINDFYSELNLDNPTPGTIYDNTKNYFDITPIFNISHKFQNTTSNTINMKSYFDNGWGMKKVETNKNITPIKYPNLTINFYWDPANPIKDRDVQVTFFDSTNDTNNLHIRTSWFIYDEFELWNLNNPQYGNSIVNNDTQFIDKSKDFTPQHYFQSNKNHLIMMYYYFDNGFEEALITLNKTLTTVEYSITPNFNSNPNNLHLGGNQIQFTNTSIDEHNRIEDINWYFYDRDGLNDNLEYIFERLNKPKNEVQNYIWRYAPRMPFAAKNTTAISEVENKTVRIDVRYDNGWNNTSKASIQKNFIAKTKEVGLSINYKNKDYEGNVIYGQEIVEFEANILDINSAKVDNTMYWILNDKNINDEDTTINITNASLIDSQFKSFLSSGLKSIVCGYSFDDGFGNIYQVEANTSLTILPYEPLILDFTWSPNEPAIFQKVTFTPNHNDVRPRGNITKIEVDYFNDNQLDMVDINGDNVSDSWYLSKNDIWYKTFNEKRDPIYIRIIATWNNGWELKQKELIKEMFMSAIAPQTHLIVDKIQYNKYRFTINAEDPDGQIEKYKLSIMFKNPSMITEPCKQCENGQNQYPELESLDCCTDEKIFGEYIKIYESDWQNLNIFWNSLSSNGYYKIIGYAIDNDSQITSSEQEIIVESEGTITPPPSGECIICTKRCIGGIVKIYPFEVNIVKGKGPTSKFTF